MNIPQCIHVNGDDEKGYSIEIPLAQEGVIHHKHTETFDEAIDYVRDSIKEYGIAHYSLVINL